MLRAIRYVAWAMVAGVAVLSLLLVASPDMRERLLGGSGSYAVADVGGPFSLVDQDGERVTEADFAGRPTVIFFGFTHCPDVCPTTLFEMTSWLERLGDDAQALNVAFVTVDPERDTPEVLSRYLSAFDERILGLTGQPEDVAAALEAYRVYARKVETDDGGYTMDHTASVYLMDSEGNFFGTIAYGEDDDVALQKLRRLVEQG